MSTVYGSTDQFKAGKGAYCPKTGKAVYSHPTYLTSMQSKSWKMVGWMTHKLESRLRGEISTSSDVHMILC